MKTIQTTVCTTLTDTANDVVVVVPLVVFGTTFRHPHAKFGDATSSSIFDEGDARVDRVLADPTSLPGAGGSFVRRSPFERSISYANRRHDAYRSAW